MSGEFGCVDMIEGFYDLRVRQLRLQQLGSRCRFVIEFGKVTVAVRIVIIGIDDDLAGERRDRYLTVVLQRYRYDNDICCLSRLVGSCCSRLWSKLFDERRQSLRTSRVAEYNIVTMGHSQSCKLASYVPGTDQSDGFHIIYLGPRLVPARREKQLRN